MEKLTASDRLTGFCYASFDWLGHALLRLMPSIPSKLEAGGKRIYPVAYTSKVGFFFIVSIFVAVFLMLVTMIHEPLLAMVWVALPVLVLVVGLLYPRSSASSRASNIESEVPYAAAYVTVMATGGIAPFKSISRLGRVELLPNLSKAARQAEVDIQATGMDPVSALEKQAKAIPSKEYRDFLMGYATTLRTGGDVLHFLLRKTETIFDARMHQMKLAGERMGMLMEAYAIAGMFLAIVVYTIYIISRAMPTEYTVVPSEQFFLFGYVLLPVLSGIFLYFADIMQPRYPSSDWTVYKVFLMTTPAALFMLVALVFPFYSDVFSLIFAPFRQVVVWLTSFMQLGIGFESAVALCLVFIIWMTPAAVVHARIAREGSGVMSGITSFLRDLTEARKTGMSPERCIKLLAKRDYSRFSKYLRSAANQLGWGVSLSRVYRWFAEKSKAWLPKASMFVLIDAIDVGGGAPETLDTLATFSEKILEVEKQKRAALRPLMLIPYVTGVLLVSLVIILVSFMKGLLQVARISLATGEFIHLFVPPVVIVAMVSGLVAGKIADGRVSAGFRHAVILTVISLMAMWVSSYVSVQLELARP